MNTKHVIIVDDDYFKENLTVFQNKGCHITRTFIADDTFKDDLMHQKLRKAKKKASDEFYNYEFNIRNNFKK